MKLISVFFLQTSIAELMEKMLSCEVDFVRCGFYHLAQTKRNATKQNYMIATSLKDFFSGRTAVTQSTSNCVSAGAHGNGLWRPEKM